MSDFTPEQVFGSRWQSVREACGSHASMMRLLGRDPDCNLSKVWQRRGVPPGYVPQVREVLAGLGWGWPLDDPIPGESLDGLVLGLTALTRDRAPGGGEGDWVELMDRCCPAYTLHQVGERVARAVYGRRNLRDLLPADTATWCWSLYVHGVDAVLNLRVDDRAKQDLWAALCEVGLPHEQGLAGSLE